MPLAGIVTLVGVALVVAALAIYLITVAVLLRSVSFNLGTIIAGLNAIAMQTEQLRPQFDRVNRNLESARQTMDDFVARQAPAGPQKAQQPRGGGAASTPPRRKATGRKSTKASAARAPGHKPTGRS